MTTPMTAWGPQAGAAELMEHVSLDGVVQPAGRPYVWSNHVMSVDGRITYGGAHSEGKYVALAHEGFDAARMDWGVVEASWSTADAVLMTRRNLEDAPELVCLGKAAYAPHGGAEANSPLQVIVTHSGTLAISHPILSAAPPQPPQPSAPPRAVVFAPAKHVETLTSLLAAQSPRVEVCAAPVHASLADCLDMKWILARLLAAYGVRSLDVTGGGRLIGSLVHDKLLDEMRITVAGSLIGGSTALRPPIFSDLGSPFDALSSPILSVMRCAVYPPAHIFLRYGVRYRH